MLGHAETDLFGQIMAQIGAEATANWVKILTTAREGKAATVLEWLRDPPHRAGREDIGDHVERAQWLRDLGVDGGDWTRIAEARLYHYAKPMLRRKPVALRRLREPRRSIELACFLRRQLLRLNDTILDLADHRTADLCPLLKLQPAHRPIDPLCIDSPAGQPGGGYDSAAESERG